jgi:alkyl sulfatase BDS1-like metallo-beta-lactamase superfamily hydrolase
MPIIAPGTIRAFDKFAIGENVVAGNAMSRRAGYAFGNLLDFGPEQFVSCGMAVGSVVGPLTVFYLSRRAQLCPLHRRDAGALGRPRRGPLRSAHVAGMGPAEVVAFLESQRDTYKYIHDQALRLANKGYTPLEAAEVIELPEELRRKWFNRGYHGTLHHDVRAVYTKELGMWDGDPVSLHPHPLVESAKRYVELIGAEALLAEGRRTFEAADYRWAAEILHKLVFTDPSNQEARVAGRRLRADGLPGRRPPRQPPTSASDGRPTGRSRTCHADRRRVRPRYLQRSYRHLRHWLPHRDPLNRSFRRITSAATGTP